MPGGIESVLLTGYSVGASQGLVAAIRSMLLSRKQESLSRPCCAATSPA